MISFPRTIEAGNAGDGSPLTLGNAEAVGDLFLPSGTMHVLNWGGDARSKVVKRANRHGFHMRHIPSVSPRRAGRATAIKPSAPPSTKIAPILDRNCSLRYGDRLPEDNESFSVVLSAPSNATLSKSAAICKIVDDDQ